MISVFARALHRSGSSSLCATAAIAASSTSSESFVAISDPV
jgi:hypothetical protein